MTASPLWPFLPQFLEIQENTWTAEPFPCAALLTFKSCRLPLPLWLWECYVVGDEESKSFVWAFLPLPPDFQDDIWIAEPFCCCIIGCVFFYCVLFGNDESKSATGVPAP